MHKQVTNSRLGERLLELGVGTLNHVPYETNVSRYDAVEPFHQLWQTSPHRKRLASIQDDVGKISGERSYDRIISIAVLELSGSQIVNTVLG
jgi:hypothetical protein